MAGHLHHSRSFDYLYRRSGYRLWQQQQRQQQVLRSQIGFESDGLKPDRFSKPAVCEGCQNYFGVAYGYSQRTRSMLICALHPQGWIQDGNCPDWQGSLL
ncbi:MAG: hypothetical protein VKJ24_07965 [Synechococcales bacterium]|nr:hypothetical protein [Synechococcales bacterium]